MKPRYISIIYTIASIGILIGTGACLGQSRTFLKESKIEERKIMQPIDCDSIKGKSLCQQTLVLLDTTQLVDNFCAEEIIRAICKVVGENPTFIYGTFGPQYVSDSTLKVDVLRWRRKLNCTQ